MSRQASTPHSDRWRSGCCGRSAQPTASTWPTSPAASCAGSVRGSRSTRSAAPISQPPFRRNLRPKSKRSCAAFGTISDAWQPSSLTSIACKASIPTRLDAPIKLLRVLGAGGHVAMVVDQHYVNGVDVTFFGRRCKANPFIARLARHVDCPIHGTRIIRLPDRHRFRVDLTEAIEPRRDVDGKIDVEVTMQAITSVIEGWVREYPEQWLWVHRRWR